MGLGARIGDRGADVWGTHPCPSLEHRYPEIYRQKIPGCKTENVGVWADGYASSPSVRLVELPRLLSGHDRKIRLAFGLRWHCGAPPFIDERLEHPP